MKTIKASMLLLSGEKLFKCSATPAIEAEFVWENYTKIVRDRFHEGLTSDCHTLLPYKDVILTEEQIKAHHDFFGRRYNTDI